MKSGPKPGDETTRVHYIYDAWNRLVGVRADNSGDPGTLIAEYSYDGLNRRIEKEVTAGSVDTHYYYNDEWQMLEERQVDGTGTTIESNDYVWSARYIDSPIVRFHDDNGDGDCEDAGDNTHYYTTDANHNITAVIDASTGNVVTYYTYTPYGEPTAYDAAWSNPAAPTEDGPLYCGYFFDAESELYQVRNRYYDSSIGGFVTRDPIGYEGEDSNLYRYVQNNPIIYSDAKGLRISIEGDACNSSDIIVGRDLAGVVCSDGDKVLCVWRHPIDIPEKTGRAKLIITACLYAHELFHAQFHIDCPACGVSRGRLNGKTQKDKTNQECAAHIVERTCLQVGKWACLGDEGCEFDVNSRISEIDTMLKAWGCRGWSQWTR